jgi:hypothetical protein
MLQLGHRILLTQVLPGALLFLASHFTVGDVREAVAVASDYDLVLLLALGPVLGDLVDTVGTLRRCVRSGGLVLVDEAYLRDGIPTLDDVEDCFDHETTVQRLEAHGDRLVVERVIDTPEAEAWCRSMTAEIVKRARLPPPSSTSPSDSAVRRRSSMGPSFALCF